MIVLLPQVLRFYCCWDDPGSVEGDKTPYIVYYYLVDDTIEVAEVHPRNDGRDGFPIMLHRCKLPMSGKVPSGEN